jgi:hypothetical protein
MAMRSKGTKGTKGRSLFEEISAGVQSMQDQREGRLRLRAHEVPPPASTARRAGADTVWKARPMVYQLKVTLLETDPPIWRRLRVPGKTSLARLDRIVQTAMGWTDSHLHTFTAGGIVYSDPSSEWETPVRNERRARLEQIAKEDGEAFIYEYDMGDSWRHQVLVEEVRAGAGDGEGPVCLAGERACPPEDCGGVHGYYETLERLRDPDDDEHEQTKTWIEAMRGGPFDPDAFDIEAVNRALRKLR